MSALGAANETGAHAFKLRAGFIIEWKQIGTEEGLNMGIMESIQSIALTQQDFISTFPWGIRGDRIRIIQRETENTLLDAETAAAMAVILGSESFSNDMDRAWKLYLNSQNHDVHVCLADEAGLSWCGEAAEIAGRVRAAAGGYIAQKAGGGVALNTLPWDRQGVPSYGYARPEAAAVESDKDCPWEGWFQTPNYHARTAGGVVEIEMPGAQGVCASLGYLTVFAEGTYFDTREQKPNRVTARLIGDNMARLRVEGELCGILYDLTFTLRSEGIDVDIDLDYGDGRCFGPDISDFETDPRRTHYFQHEKKLCINWKLEKPAVRVLYNSPFLTWPADDTARSLDSLDALVMEGDGFGVAHLNAGQSGYGYRREDTSCAHVLAFSPHDYIYGKPEKLTLSGRHIHHCRFIPYSGGWRDMKLPQRIAEYLRPVFGTCETAAAGADTKPASLLSVASGSTMATALFEREGRVYIRVWEWAGQEDRVEIRGAVSALTECTHGLLPIGALRETFAMRPWEIKTIELTSGAIPSQRQGMCGMTETFAAEPKGWGAPNRFHDPQAGSAEVPGQGGILYFASGYHDGFVKPLEQPTPTMLTEMERVHRYKGYASTWELGGSCFESFAVHCPSFLKTLQPYLREGSVEIVGGTWCEPFGLIVSGESNIRQIFYGTEAIRRALDYDIRVYANQEHGTYAQQPQILASFGIRAAVNRTQWAPYGYESAVDADVVRWEAPDGTGILMIPRYNSMDYVTCPWDDRNLQNGSITGHNRVWRSDENYAKMLDSALRHGIRHPLMTMLEDIWDPGLRTTNKEMDFDSSIPHVQFISITRYLEMLGFGMNK